MPVYENWFQCAMRPKKETDPGLKRTVYWRTYGAWSWVAARPSRYLDLSEKKQGVMKWSGQKWLYSSHNLPNLSQDNVKESGTFLVPGSGCKLPYTVQFLSNHSIVRNYVEKYQSQLLRGIFGG